ncbi:hypothetical protein GTY85_29620 [Streptomyces sp. SID8377]|nr:hypothetical protein [Streptomyces sp. SID8377]
MWVACACGGHPPPSRPPPAFGRGDPHPGWSVRVSRGSWWAGGGASRTCGPVGHAPGEVVLQLPSAGTAKVLRTLDDFARYL